MISHMAQCRTEVVEFEDVIETIEERECGIELRVQVEFGRILRFESDLQSFFCRPLNRRFDHLGRDVDTRHFEAFFGEHSAEFSGSTRDFENALRLHFEFRPNEFQIADPHPVWHALHEQFVMRRDLCECVHAAIRLSLSMATSPHFGRR